VRCSRRRAEGAVLAGADDTDNFRKRCVTFESSRLVFEVAPDNELNGLFRLVGC